MKNKKIFDAWNKAGPDAAADARMLGAILARNAGQSQTRKVYPMNKMMHWKRLAPIAACLVLAIAAVAFVPKLTARPPAPAQPAATQNGPEKIQQMTLPAMLAGQEVKWQNLSLGETDPKADNADEWSVMVQTKDGLELKFGSTDTKVIGTLADGRKIVVATEETGRVQGKGKKNTSAVSVSVPDDAGFVGSIEVGATIMEINHTDETGMTITYRSYIESIT